MDEDNLPKELAEIADAFAGDRIQFPIGYLAGIAMTSYLAWMALAGPETLEVFFIIDTRSYWLAWWSLWIGIMFVGGHGFLGGVALIDLLFRYREAPFDVVGKQLETDEGFRYETLRRPGWWIAIRTAAIAVLVAFAFLGAGNAAIEWLGYSSEWMAEHRLRCLAATVLMTYSGLSSLIFIDMCLFRWRQRRRLEAILK